VYTHPCRGREADEMLRRPLPPTTGRAHPDPDRNKKEEQKMDDEKIYCPLTREECMESNCGWYADTDEKCGIPAIANALYEVEWNREIIEEDKAEKTRRKENAENV